MRRARRRSGPSAASRRVLAVSRSWWNSCDAAGRDRHPAHAAIPRDQSAVPRHDPVFPDGRLLRDVRGRCAPRARELGLALTSRNNGGAADVPLAGVPVKAATEYVRRLIVKGHRVAICEQVEDPKLAKGLVRREVVETVTPGTVLSDDWLERNCNNYLVALDPRGT